MCSIFVGDMIRNRQNEVGKSQTQKDKTRDNRRKLIVLRKNQLMYEVKYEILKVRRKVAVMDEFYMKRITTAVETLADFLAHYRKRS